MAMRSLGYMPNEVELEVIIQRLDIDGMLFCRRSRRSYVAPSRCCRCSSAGDGQVGFEEFVTLLGPKLSCAGMPDKFNGADFDSVFWKVPHTSRRLRTVSMSPLGISHPRFVIFSVRHAEADSGRAEEAAVRYFPRPPDHERHREHHHDGGEPPEQPRVSRGHRQ